MDVGSVVLVRDSDEVATRGCSWSSRARAGPVFALTPLLTMLLVEPVTAGALAGLRMVAIGPVLAHR